MFDHDMGKLMEVPLSQPSSIYGMFNGNMLYFLNGKSQIEAWSIDSKSLMQKADCRPAVIKQLYFLDS